MVSTKRWTLLTAISYQIAVSFIHDFLFQFGFEFIGRVVREHVHAGSVLGEEVGDGLGLEGDGGFEVIALHVGEDGLAHLTGNKTVVEVGVDVHRGHQQLALEDVGLDEHTEFA